MTIEPRVAGPDRLVLETVVDVIQSQLTAKACTTYAAARHGSRQPVHAASCEMQGMMFLTDALDCNEIGDTQLQVQFDDKKLEKLCTDEREMRKQRSDIAPRLRLRINALRAAETLGKLVELDPLGKWHPLSADLGGLWSGKLSANYRILVRPEGTSDPQDAVTVTVIDIDDYH